MLISLFVGQRALMTTAGIGILLCIAGLLLHRRDMAPKTTSLVITVGICVIIGPALATFHSVSDRIDPFATAIDKGSFVSAVLTLSSYPESGITGKSEVLARLESVNGAPSELTVRLSAATEKAANWRRGDRLEVRGLAEDTYEADRAYGQIRVSEAELIERGPDFAQRIHDVLAHHANGLVLGVVVGDDSQIAEEDVLRIRQLGLSHLTAVSGAHVSLVIMGIVMLVGRKHRWGTAMLAMFSLGALLALVGNEPSVTRASMMGALVIFAIAIKRPASAFPLLCVTVIIVALVSPRTATTLGFLLSTSATAAIVLWGRTLSAMLATVLPKPVAELLAIPFVAGIATLPIVASIQNSFSLWTVIANAIVAPVVTPLTITGLIGGILGVASTTLASPFLAIAQMCAWWIIWCARTLVELPGSAVSLSTVLMVHVAILVSVVAIVRFRVRARACVAVGVTAFVLMTGQRPASISDDWQAVMCDVGQGSAVLVRGGGRVIMVDVGPADSNVERCLQSAGVTHIDLLVLSHFDADHVRGLEEVLSVASIERAWVSGNSHPLYNSDWALRLLTMENVRITEVKAGSTLGWRTSDAEQYILQATVLSPNVVRGGESETNADSLVVKLRTGDLEVYALGDIDESKQRQLANFLGDMPRSTATRVVIVPHHGATSQSRELRDIIDPHVTLISVGENSYGHPTRQALTVWNSDRVARTDQCGTITLTASSLISGCE